MDTIVSNNEYDNLFRTQMKKKYMLVFYIMIGVSVFEIILGLILTYASNESFMQMGVFFFIPVVMMMILGYIFFLVAKRTDREDYKHFAIEKYKNYPASQFKHPLYRIVQYGKNQEIIQQVLEIDGDIIKVTDLKKNKDNLYVNTYKQITSFKFFIKIKNEVETYKSKIILESNGKKVFLNGYAEYNERLFKYLRSQGFVTEII